MTCLSTKLTVTVEKVECPDHGEHEGKGCVIVRFPDEWSGEAAAAADRSLVDALGAWAASQVVKQQEEERA